MITIRYFAAARERAGASSEELPPPGPTLRAVVDELVRRHPTLAPLLPHLRFAVNQELAGLDAPVSDGAEIALIPPVAGGSGAAFAVLGQPLSLEQVVEAVSAKGQGGVVTFTGAVRDHSRGKPVVRLEYEAYDAMALKVLCAIGAEASAKWPGAKLAIHHRVGTLEPGELAVVIAASAPHRAEAFDACRYAIEQLKSRAPIWKKEFHPDGDHWVGLGP